MSASTAPLTEYHTFVHASAPGQPSDATLPLSTVLTLSLAPATRSVGPWYSGVIVVMSPKSQLSFVRSHACAPSSTARKVSLSEPKVLAFHRHPYRLSGHLWPLLRYPPSLHDDFAAARATRPSDAVASAARTEDPVTLRRSNAVSGRALPRVAAVTDASTRARTRRHAAAHLGSRRSP